MKTRKRTKKRYTGVDATERGSGKGGREEAAASLNGLSYGFKWQRGRPAALLMYALVVEERKVDKSVGQMLHIREEMDDRRMQDRGERDKKKFTYDSERKFY